MVVFMAENADHHEVVLHKTLYYNQNFIVTYDTNRNYVIMQCLCSDILYVCCISDVSDDTTALTL